MERAAASQSGRCGLHRYDKYGNGVYIGQSEKQYFLIRRK
jgi:hypothetical protein